MRHYILIFALLACCFTLQAQESSSPLSLEQCVELSLKNNNKQRTAENNLQAAIELRKEAFTKYFPEVAATGIVFWASDDVLQYNFMDLVELGIIKNGKAAGIQAVQPVFMGGQILNGNKLAKVGEEVARLRQTQTADEVRLTTETLFWKLTTLNNTKTTLETALSLLDSLESQVAVAVEAGIVLNNDLLKVKLKQNSFKSEMEDLNNGIHLVKMLLGQYIGFGTDGDIEIAEVRLESVPSFPDSLFIPASQALLQNTNYNLLEKNVEAKKLEKKIEIGKNLPMVAVGAGWYYHDLLDQNHNFGAVQIGVEVPLSGWWGGSHAIKRKNIELINAQNELEDLSQMLEINMQDKWNNLTSAYRKMEIEREGIAQSKENLRLNRMYYESGMSTISDLLEAETSLKEVNERFITAAGNFYTAVSAYRIATGQ